MQGVLGWGDRLFKENWVGRQIMQGVLGWDDILFKEYWGGMTYCAIDCSRSTGVG